MSASDCILIVDDPPRSRRLPPVFITGNRVGKWTIVDCGGKDGRGRWRWQCRCECGQTRVVDQGNLVSGVSRSCGCLQNDRAAERRQAKDKARLTQREKKDRRLRPGKVVGRYTLLHREPDSAGWTKRWLCLCICGSIKAVSASNLTNRKRIGTISCGCFHRENKRAACQSKVGSKNHMWRGGHESAHNRCARALRNSLRSATRNGWMPCTATAEQLATTLVSECQICGTPESKCTRRLAMDHDHDTGKFRGWLCARCNLFLVDMYDKYLDKAKAYLRTARERVL